MDSRLRKKMTSKDAKVLMYVKNEIAKLRREYDIDDCRSYIQPKYFEIHPETFEEYIANKETESNVKKNRAIRQGGAIAKLIAQEIISRIGWKQEVRRDQ